jgi:hypothetical protein
VVTERLKIFRKLSKNTVPSKVNSPSLIDTAISHPQIQQSLTQSPAPQSSTQHYQHQLESKLQRHRRRLDSQHASRQRSSPCSSICPWRPRPKYPSFITRGPKEEVRDERGFRFHVRQRPVPFGPTRYVWYYEELYIPLYQTGMLLARIMMAKPRILYHSHRKILEYLNAR